MSQTGNNSMAEKEIRREIVKGRWAICTASEAMEKRAISPQTDARNPPTSPKER